jgi:hypothetical protein
MSFAALVAALMLALALFPGLVLGIEERYTWVLARVASRLSEGSLDDQTAFRRIRRGEGISPETSVRIFSLGCFLIAVLSRAFKPDRDFMPDIVVVLLALATAVLAVKAEDTPLARIGAIVLGVLCVVAIL